MFESSPVPGRPACADQIGSWCQQIYDLTDNDWLAASAEWLIAKPAKILLVIVVALVIRHVLHRFITRLTTRTREDRMPALLRPLKERVSDDLLAAASGLLSERRTQRAQTIGSVLRSVVSIIVLGIAFMLILGELGINLAPIIASAGIVGVALGFGAQNLVKDFLAGIFMVLEDQYGVGDVVDFKEATGVVEAVGLRVTTLRDVSGTVWYVRNGEVLRVGNKSQGYAVAVVDLPLAISADVTRAAELAGSVANEATSEPPLAEHVLEPPVVLGVEGVTVDSMTLRLTVKVRAGQQWTVQRALYARLRGAFAEAGIPPYPSSAPIPSG